MFFISLIFPGLEIIILNVLSLEPLDPVYYATNKSFITAISKNDLFYYRLYYTFVGKLPGGFRCGISLQRLFRINISQLDQNIALRNEMWWFWFHVDLSIYIHTLNSSYPTSHVCSPVLSSQPPVSA